MSAWNPNEETQERWAALAPRRRLAELYARSWRGEEMSADERVELVRLMTQAPFGDVAQIARCMIRGDPV